MLVNQQLMSSPLRMAAPVTAMQLRDS